MPVSAASMALNARRNTFAKSVVVAFFTLALASLASAQSGTAAKAVYRCGNSYSQEPCATGQVVDVDDARSPAQKAAADASTRALAASVRKNEEEEARIAKAQALAQAQARAAAAKKAKAQRKADETQTNGIKPRPKKRVQPSVTGDPMFTAAGPSSPKAKKAAPTDDAP